MSPAIIDFHQHAPDPAAIQQRVSACQKAGVGRAVLLGLPESHMPGDNDKVMIAAKAEPDLFIPFYGVSMDRDTPESIDRAIDQGFRGLKFIAPAKAYNDTAYFPLYEHAAERGLPVLFHLGIVANHDRWRCCDSNLMRAIHLDHIARQLPALRIVGAHFGNPWSDEAGMACRWNPNLFFDFSGSLLKYRSPQFLSDLLWWRPEGPYPSPDKSHAWSKIVFGSDVADDMIADVVGDYERMMSALNLNDTLRQLVWNGTATKLLEEVV